MALAHMEAALMTLQCYGDNVIPHLPQGDDAARWIEERERTHAGVGWILMSLQPRESTDDLLLRTICQTVRKEQTPQATLVARWQMLSASYASSKECRTMSRCARVAHDQYEKLVSILKLEEMASVVKQLCPDHRPCPRIYAFTRDMTLRAYGVPMPACAYEHCLPYACSHRLCTDVVEEMRRRTTDSGDRSDVERPLADTIFGSLPGDVLDKIVDMVYETPMHRLQSQLPDDVRAEAPAVIGMVISAYHFFGKASLSSWKTRLEAEAKEMRKIERLVRRHGGVCAMPMLNTLVVCSTGTQRQLRAMASQYGLRVGVPRPPYALHEAMRADIVCVHPSAVHELVGYTFRRVVFAHDVACFDGLSTVRAVNRWLFRIRGRIQVLNYPMPINETSVLFGGLGPRLSELADYAFFLLS